MIEMVIDARRKDLGGFEVGRVLPFHARRMVGPFIFVDQFGPAQLDIGAGMDVRPHPHINLATVTWLFEGAIDHKRQGFARITATPMVRMKNVANFGKAVEPSLADELAVVLDDEVLALAGLDDHHRRKPVTGRLKIAMRQRRPIGHRARVAEDGVQRLDVIRPRGPQHQPFSAELHGSA